VRARVTPAARHNDDVAHSATGTPHSRRRAVGPQFQSNTTGFAALSRGTHIISERGRAALNARLLRAAGTGRVAFLTSSRECAYPVPQHV
jgi:hypothetical protein